MIRSVTLPVKRPSIVLLGAALRRAAYEYLSYRLARKPLPATADGHPVIIFPGLGIDARVVADRLLQKPDRRGACKEFESATSKKPAVFGLQWTIT